MCRIKQPTANSQQPTANSQRIEYIDVLKTFTIFCVLWGHCIQQLDNGLIIPWRNPVISYIYSFHMPLFYLLSGLFFKSSLKNNIKEFVVKKGMQLLLPYMVWCILRGSYLVIYSIFYMNRVLTIVEIIKTIFGGHFWFLRELFISYFITYVGYRIFKKRYIMVLLCVCFTLFAPLMSLQSFYLPMFFIGIFVKEKYSFIKKHINKILVISGILFGICLPFWKGEYYGIYPKIFSWKQMSFNLSNVPTSIYRLLTGVSGSIFFLTFFQKIYKGNEVFKHLGNYGQYTLEIYILQVIIIETILTKAIDFPNTNIWVYSFIYTLIIVLLVFIFCIFIIKIIQMNKYANCILFGRIIKIEK